MGAKYEIYLDESGMFEVPEKGAKRDVCLIGGLVVPEVLKAREDELREQLMKLGKPYFPEMKSVTHIHMRELDFNRQQELRGLLIDFFKEEMKDALITFIYSPEELEEKHPAGPQFYRCMLINLLKTVVLYHPSFGASDKLQVMLAHRRAVGYVAAMRDDLLAQGYHKLKDKSGKIDVTAITNADVITIMKMLKDSLNFTSDKVDSYKMNVITGDNNDSYRMKPYAEWDSPFMAMADFVCNTLHHTIQKNPDPNKLEAEVNRLFGNRIFFYASNTYDFPFSLMSHFHRGSPDKFIADYLKMTKGRTDSDRISDSFLINPAIKRISQEIIGRVDDSSVFANIVALADDFLVNSKFHRLGDVYDLIKLVSEKLDFIAEGPADQQWDPIAYQYHDVCLRYYNHTSDVINGLKHWKKALIIYKRLPGTTKEIGQLRKRHELLNRISVFFSNSFAFDMAVTILDRVKDKEEAIAAILAPSRNEILGKVYGSLSQNYAFKQQWEKADECMRKAVEHLGPQQMQLSFRAHMALDQKDEPTYKRYVMDIFQLTEFPGFNPLLECVTTSLEIHKFDLLLLLKGLLTCQIETSDEEKSREILSRDTFMNAIWERNGHPWQLTWILMGRLLNKWGKNKIANNFLQKSAGYAKSPDQHTFIMMGHAARAWQALFELEQNNDRKAREIISPIRETFRDLKDSNRIIGTYNPNNIADEDGRIHTGWFDEVGNKFVNFPEIAVKEEIRGICREFLSRFTFNYW